MDAPEAPPAQITVQGNVENVRSTIRHDVTFAIQQHATDSGLVFNDPAGYYTNLSLTGARTLALWLATWCTYQTMRFKPTGFALTHITTGERRERPEGAAIVLIGDSFYIHDASGTDLTGALPCTDWEMQPMFAHTP